MSKERMIANEVITANDYMLMLKFVCYNNEAERLNKEALNCVDKRKADALWHQYNSMNTLRNRTATALGYDFYGNKKRRRVVKIIKKIVTNQSRLYVMDM